MDLFATTERLMGLDDQAWRRHANPWSVYSRFSILPLLALAIWARVLVGWWSLALVGAVAIWAWLNPRVFPPPEGKPGWAAKGVLGERLLIARAEAGLPHGHAAWARWLSLAAALGLVPFAYGLWQRDLGMTLFGLTLSMGAKAWFFDRMVFLAETLGGSEIEGREDGGMV